MKPELFSVAAGRAEAAYEKALKKAVRNSAMSRIMDRDAAVFTRKANLKEKIANRLGWVDIAGGMRRRVASIEAFGHDVIRAGFRHVLLMGMGGSSLAPQLFGQVHECHERMASFDVLDSTDPKAIKAVTRKLNPNRTLFIVSSKSGTTVETRSHMMHFMGMLEHSGFTRPGRQFVAITDKGSALHQFARGEEFRKIYLNPEDIGGRYSALSYFGLVPAYFAGADLEALLADAGGMERLVRERNDETNPAVVLGSLLAVAAGEGVNKLTFLASKQLAPLVPWIEQLVAESTGKDGKGIVPIDAEPVGDLKEYQSDRLFVTLRMTSEKPVVPDEMRDALKKKGYPLIDIRLSSLEQLGRQFVLWEAATALAGYHMGINPFDEPNVTESKQNTNKILDVYRESGQFADQTPSATYKKLSLLTHGGRRKYTLSEIANLRTLTERFFSGLKKPQFVSFLCYFREDRQIEKTIAEMREAVRRKYRVATLRGYGPRFLHSIGQLYKGGPPVGRYIIFVRADYEPLEVPGRFYDFGQLITAQAIGDARALLGRDLPILVFAVEGSAAKGLKEFADVVHAVCK